MSKSFIDRLMPAPVGGGFKMDGYWVWCGSAIKSHKDGLYHLFASRWGKRLPMFEGYILSSEIVRAVSERPEGPYRFVEKVLPFGPDENRWDGRMAHNPSIHFFNGRYYLFYIGSTYKGEIPVSLANGERPPICGECYSGIRIGVLWADSPEGPWNRAEEPALVPRPGKWDHQVVTNPAPCILPDGRAYLYYRGNTPEGLRIGLAVAPSPEGPYERIQDDPVLKGMDVEDPFAWHNGRHFEMLAKDMTGKLTGEKHAGVHLRSDDGISWQSLGKGYSRKVLWNDGRTIELGSLERPQLLLDSDRQPQYLFAAMADGPGGFEKAKSTWNGVIPLA